VPTGDLTNSGDCPKGQYQGVVYFRIGGACHRSFSSGSIAIDEVVAKTG
jgi:hypothetical protein